MLLFINDVHIILRTELSSILCKYGIQTRVKWSSSSVLPWSTFYLGLSASKLRAISKLREIYVVHNLSCQLIMVFVY